MQRRMRRAKVKRRRRKEKARARRRRTRQLRQGRRIRRRNRAHQIPHHPLLKAVDSHQARKQSRSQNNPNPPNHPMSHLKSVPLPPPLPARVLRLQPHRARRKQSRIANVKPDLKCHRLPRLLLLHLRCQALDLLLLYIFTININQLDLVR